MDLRAFGLRAAKISSPQVHARRFAMMKLRAAKLHHRKSVLALISQYFALRA
jgi:hypothetical protein